MPNEIERKFFVKTMPDLSGIHPLHYERCFLRRTATEEERISKINDKYVYERKINISPLERSREKKEITEEEFNELRSGASEAILRDRFDISENPKISLQVYHGRYEGLVRAEVEFATRDEAEKYVPPEWMGSEMTGLPIARDSKLVDLSDEAFRAYLT